MLAQLKKLLFENRGMRQTIFKNTFWLVAAEGITKILRFILIIYMVRILGVAQYGHFSFALSFAALFTVFSNLGVSNFLTREFSQDRQKEKDYPSIITLKIVLSFLVLLLTFVFSFFITDDPGIRMIILVLGLYNFVDGFFSIVYPFIRARQKMEYEALCRIALTGVTFSICFFVLFNFPSPINLSYAYLFGSFVLLLLSAVYFHFFVYFLRFKFNFYFWVELLKKSWPLSFGFVGLSFYINLDSTVIGFFRESSEIGWFNAAAKIILSITFVSAGLLVRSFYPALSGLLKDSIEKLQKAWNYCMNTMILLAIPFVAGGIIFASKIISFAYGLDDFAPSVFVFQVLVVLAGLTFLYYPYSMILVVAGRQKTNFLIITLGFVLNAILNIVLIPRFGFNAAAISTAAVGLIILLLAAFYSKNTPIKPFNTGLLKTLLISFFSCLIMVVVVGHPVVYNLNLIISVFIGALVYFISIFAAKNALKVFFPAHSNEVI